MSTQNKTSTLGATLLLLAGLLTVFVSQRILTDGTAHNATQYGGLLLCALAGVLRVKAWSSAQGDTRGVEGRLLGSYLGCYASLGLYALSTDAGIQKLGLTGDAALHTGGVLAVLWPSLLLVSLTALLFIELVYLRMPIAASVELRRVRTALYAGLTLGLSAVFLLSINYVATARDVRKDVSYFRTTQPSEATRAMIAKLDKPMRVVLFFPQANDVEQEMRPYFDVLAKTNKKLSVTTMDVALAPDLATKYKVRENGNVLLIQDAGDSTKNADTKADPSKPDQTKPDQAKKDQTKGETFRIGQELTEARGTLKKLDAMFQQSFAKLARPERLLYLTVGHGERNAKLSDSRGPDATTLLEEILRRLNLKTKDFGMAQGLAREVPAEASAVLVIGPTERFMPEEAETLLAYVRKGGKVFLMIDPGEDLGLAPLLTGLGLETLPGTVNSETSHMAHSYNASDRGIVFTNHYSAHPSVTTVSRHQREVASVFVNAVALNGSKQQVDPKPLINFPMRSDAQFWRDLNGNFEHDANEPFETLNLMAASTIAVPAKGDEKPGEGRAVVIGDGDFMTNKLASNNGNMLPFVDTLAWLVGNEEINGEATSEEDIPIEHSREQDKVWFYATTFAMPAPIVLVGSWVARRRRRSAETKS
jgi:hypothetical protein